MEKESKSLNSLWRHRLLKLLFIVLFIILFAWAFIDWTQWGYIGDLLGIMLLFLIGFFIINALYYEGVMYVIYGKSFPSLTRKIFVRLFRKRKKIQKISIDKKKEIIKDMEEEKVLGEQKYIQRVTGYGLSIKILGFLKIVLGVCVIVLKFFNTVFVKYIELGYTDIVFHILLGVVLIILGGRLHKHLAKGAKQQIIAICIITLVVTILTIISGNKATISLIFFVYGLYVLSILSKLKLPNTNKKYKLRGWKWFLLSFFFLLLVLFGTAIDIMIEDNNQETNNTIDNSSNQLNTSTSKWK